MGNKIPRFLALMIVILVLLTTSQTVQTETVLSHDGEKGVMVSAQHDAMSVDNFKILDTNLVNLSEAALSEMNSTETTILMAVISEGKKDTMMVSDSLEVIVAATIANQPIVRAESNSVDNLTMVISSMRARAPSVNMNLNSVNANLLISDNDVIHYNEIHSSVMSHNSVSRSYNG